MTKVNKLAVQVSRSCSQRKGRRRETSEEAKAGRVLVRPFKYWRR
jgi:hypothetical protein